MRFNFAGGLITLSKQQHPTEMKEVNGTPAGVSNPAQTLTITEAASELRVSHWTVRRALRRNQLKHIRLGHRTVRIHRESFAQYKEARTR